MTVCSYQGCFPHPNETPPTGMWQREELRVVHGECLDSLGHGALPPGSQIMPLSVLTAMNYHLICAPRTAVQLLRCRLDFGPIAEWFLPFRSCETHTGRAILVVPGHEFPPSSGKIYPGVDFTTTAPQFLVRWLQQRTPFRFLRLNHSCTPGDVGTKAPIDGRPVPTLGVIRRGRLDRRANSPPSSVERRPIGNIS
jgi:hypothetical protein